MAVVSSGAIVVPKTRLIVLVLGAFLLYALAFLYLCDSNTSEHRSNSTPLEDSDALRDLKLPCPTCATCEVCEPQRTCPPQVECKEKVCPIRPPSPCPELAVETSSAASKPGSLHAAIEVTTLFSPAPGSSDSEGTVYTIAGRGQHSRRGDQYKLCSFTNVCASADKLYLTHSNLAEAEEWAKEWTEKCWKIEQWKQPAMCTCFHPGFLPAFLTTAQMAAKQSGVEATMEKEGVTKAREGWEHTWAVHKVSLRVTA